MTWLLVGALLPAMMAALRAVNYLAGFCVGWFPGDLIVKADAHDPGYRPGWHWLRGKSRQPPSSVFDTTDLQLCGDRPINFLKP